MAAAFSGLRTLCLAINKSLWISGEAGTQYSCVRVWAGHWNDWSSGGLRARKNAVWWDCRLGGREGSGTGADYVQGNKRHTSLSSGINMEKMCGKRRFLTKEVYFPTMILRGKESVNKAEASLIVVDSVVLWHLATTLSTFETGLPMSSLCLWDNNNLNEGWLLIGPDRSQSESKEWVTSKLLHLSALTWYFTWLSTDPASHYLSNTIQNWGSLCPVGSCSRGVPVCLASLGQRPGDMAVANFHYITRMSSGFKVYILEGELDYPFSFIASWWHWILITSRRIKYQLFSSCAMSWPYMLPVSTTEAFLHVICRIFVEIQN